MITVRKSEDRGHADYGWLDTYYSFSFANYYNPEFMGFRDLRVINEDRIEAKQGFGTHPHNDMEIITYVISGALGHRDSMGHVQKIKPGEVQVMTAGSGITHSEYNHSQTEETHLLQIWLLPKADGLTPRYDQKIFNQEGKQNALKLIVSVDGRDESLMINQDVSLYSSLLKNGNEMTHLLEPSRHAWLQVISGKLKVNEVSLTGGDGASISDEKQLYIIAEDDSEFLLFDLA